MTPAENSKGKVKHGSNLSGNSARKWVSSQCNSTLGGLVEDAFKRTQERYGPELAQDWKLNSLVRPQVLLDLKRICATFDVPEHLLKMIINTEVRETREKVYDVCLPKELYHFLRRGERLHRLSQRVSVTGSRLGYEIRPPREVDLLLSAQAEPRPMSLATRQTPEPLCVGGLRISVLVMHYSLEGYSSVGLRSTLVEEGSSAIPKGWKTRWQEAFALADSELRNGNITNNPILAPRLVQRPGISDVASPFKGGLRLSMVDFLTKRSAVIFYHKLLTHEEKAQLIARAEKWRIDELLGQSLNTQLAVISSDGDIMFVKRRSGLPNGGRLTCGVSKMMQEQDVRIVNGKDVPDAHITGLRSLGMELGLSLQIYGSELRSCMKYTSLILDEDYYELILTGVVDFRVSSSSRLRQATTSASLIGSVRRLAAKGRWKNSEVFFVPPDTQKIAKFVSENDVTNYGTACSIFALQHLGKSRSSIDDAFHAAFPP